MLHKDWKLALVSLTVLPFVLVPTARIGRRIRRTSRRTQDDAAELNQILQETLSGHQVVKAFGAEELRSRAASAQPPQRLRRSNLRYVLQQAHRVAADRVVRRADHRRPADLCAHADRGRAR